MLGAVLLAFCRVAVGAELPASPTVGIEGAMVVEIEGPRLFVTQRDEDPLLYLWIDDVKDNGTSFTYGFRYIGMKPGKQNFFYYLTYEGESSPNGLREKVTVEIQIGRASCRERV